MNETNPIANPCASALPRVWRRLLDAASRVESGGACASPCQSICQMHAASGWCEGCLRSIDEIATWAALDEGDQRAIWSQIPQRMAQRIRLEQAA